MPGHAARRRFAREEIGDQFTPGGSAVTLAERIAKVGERSESAPARDAEPCPALFEVAAREHIRVVGPECCLCAGSTEPLVAIGRDDQVIARMGAVREKNQAHGDQAEMKRSTWRSSPGCKTAERP